MLYIGEINDLDKKDIYIELRKNTHKYDSDHLFIPKAIFNNFLEYIKDIKIIDHIDMNLKYSTSKYRYSVYIIKKST